MRKDWEKRRKGERERRSVRDHVIGRFDDVICGFGEVAIFMVLLCFMVVTFLQN
jgi:hypothetical protein